MHCRPSWTDRDTAGGVLTVQLAAPEIARPRQGPTPATSSQLAVGSGALWMKCCQAVDRHFRNREWLVLEGEPGVGKTTMARATHQRRTPAAHLRLLDADDYGPRWIAEIIDELENGSGGTLVLSHVDRLPPDGAAGCSSTRSNRTASPPTRSGPGSS